LKLLLPILSRHLRHGGVTQFVINFLQALPKTVQARDLQSDIGSDLKVSVSGKIDGFFRKVIYTVNLVLFSFKLKHVDHVLLNPSLGKKAMDRDLYYAKKCIDKKIPFTFFIHGWDWSFADALDEEAVYRDRIVNVLNSSSAIYVLCSAFKDKLMSWGVPEQLVHLEFTTVNDAFMPENAVVRSQNSPKKILFLARVVKEKGIFEALEAFKIHLQHTPDSIFMVGGAGPDLEKAKAYVKDHHIANVQFYGFVEGEEKKKLLEDSDIFLFPTYYPEGMPICIFEAMAYGQFVITRPVGGVVDYFAPEMGMIIDSTNPMDFAKALNSAVSDVDRLKQVSTFNHKFVSENCKSTVVTKRILSRMECLHGNA
jgi:glycosyltransferase involved in cell wall biosynthesis